MEARYVAVEGRFGLNERLEDDLQLGFQHASVKAPGGPLS